MQPDTLSCLFFLSALAVGCGSSHAGPDDAAADAGDAAEDATEDSGAGDAAVTDGRTDTAIVDPPPTAFGASVGAAQFSLCDCHHGFGPGADGWIDLQLTNGTGSTLAVTVVSIALIPVAGGPTLTTSFSGGLVTGVPPGWSALPEGIAETRLTAVIDTDQTVRDLVGSYIVEVKLDVAGSDVTLSSDPIDVPYVAEG